MNYKLSRIIYNFKKYGFVKTIKKIISRLFKLDKRTSELDKELYQNWILHNEPTKEELVEQEYTRFAKEPLISIIIPMYNTFETNFWKLFASITSQTYKNWEVCIADGSDKKNEYMISILEKYDSVKYIFLEGNKGIAENTNKALNLAEGEYVVFLDHDDTLAPFAIFELIKTINENPDVEIIYSDEDKINEEDERFCPYFKPDYSPETLECHNYITHLVAVKKSLCDKLGRFVCDLDGAQDFDYILRATEKSKNIVHIPKILYHWRTTPFSTAQDVENKLYAYKAGRQVIQDYLKRTGKAGEVEESGDVPGIYKIKYKVNGNPKVSILIPNKNHHNDLKRCINSILKLTTYENYEILILENGTTDEITLKYYDEIKQNPKIRILDTKMDEFNYSKIINFGVKNSDADFILQLNNDTKLLTPNWLELMIGYAQNSEIGAVRSTPILS